MIHDFIHDLSHGDLPAEVRGAARRAVLDLLGVAAAATTTPLSRIVRDFVAAECAAGQGAPAAAMLFDGRRVSPSGAAMAGAFTIDALDAHDGYRPSMGHAGCSVLPAAFATAESRTPGAEVLTRIVLGYEIACRAGVALHESVADYHTSGAWGAIACAAIGARSLGLSGTATREALGIAEYHGPRSQMMRCIAHPTMVKDGSGWGAMAGVAAAGLAARGFTGAPAVTLEDPALAHHWRDLGSRWLMLEQYMKPEPVCRWAQPAIHAALALRARHGIDPGRIVRIEVATFDKATKLDHRAPATTEIAQYALPFPLAAALVHGEVGPEAVTGTGLTDPAVLALARRVEMRVDPAAEAVFPGRRVASVTIELEDGARHASGPTETDGDPERPLSDTALSAKFHRFAGSVMDAARAGRIEAAVAGIEQAPFAALADLLGPVARDAPAAAATA